MPMIPINIDELLDGTIIEDNRIEFKSDWNPEKVLHTICAFANDYDNIGGGYIVVGVAEIDGRPIDYKGFDPKTLPAVERELSELCNLISPVRTKHIIGKVSWEGPSRDMGARRGDASIQMSGLPV